MCIYMCGMRGEGERGGRKGKRDSRFDACEPFSRSCKVLIH